MAVAFEVRLRQILVAVRGDDGRVQPDAGHALELTPGSSAQGQPNPFSTLWNGAEEVLRSMSYYEMKNRAGVIGQKGLGPMLGKLAAADRGIRVHLMGHSFGARLVAYSLSGLPRRRAARTARSRPCT